MTLPLTGLTSAIGKMNGSEEDAKRTKIGLGAIALTAVAGAVATVATGSIPYGPCAGGLSGGLIMYFSGRQSL